MSSAAPARREAPAACPGCGAPIAADQRYCLECGERLMPISDFLFGAGGSQPAGGGAPPPGPPSPPVAAAAPRNNTLSILASVGVLLVAMGVGVLIGRAGNAKSTTTPPPQVISVGSSGSDSSGSSASSESTFTSDWPVAKSGYTVQLRTLSQSSSASAVEAARSAAGAKGAKAVGALSSEEFSSLPADGYVVYSGEYKTAGEARKALAALRKSFPQAKVIHVAGGSSSSTGASESSGGASGGSSSSSSSGKGSSATKPAPSTVLKNLDNTHGKSYEEKSKNLPNVVETG